MTDPTFRCGWRIQRHRDDVHPLAYSNMVIIRRGEFRMQIMAELFDSLTDADFAKYAGHAYREFAFEHLQADLAVLARQLLGELEAGYEVILTAVPYDEVKAALYRWQRAERDTERPT